MGAMGGGNRSRTQSRIHGGWGSMRAGHAPAKGTGIHSTTTASGGRPAARSRCALLRPHTTPLTSRPGVEPRHGAVGHVALVPRSPRPHQALNLAQQVRRQHLRRVLHLIVRLAGRGRVGRVARCLHRANVEVGEARGQAHVGPGAGRQLAERGVEARKGVEPRGQGRGGRGLLQRRGLRRRWQGSGL